MIFFRDLVQEPNSFSLAFVEFLRTLLLRSMSYSFFTASPIPELINVFIFFRQILVCQYAIWHCVEILILCTIASGWLFPTSHIWLFRLLQIVVFTKYTIHFFPTLSPYNLLLLYFLRMIRFFFDVANPLALICTAINWDLVCFWCSVHHMCNIYSLLLELSILLLFSTCFFRFYDCPFLIVLNLFIITW